jgi:crotonobetainyl-CoA:carnitine CoA-transferase CaiB-like acyl-CoA transferase
MAALYHRERTGEGQFIDLSQAEASVSLLSTDILEFSANGRLPGRHGNRSRDHCPHGAFRCAGEDRWCAISVRGEEDWGRLCAAIGRPELTGDPRFCTHLARKRHEEEVEALVERWTEERDAWDAMHTLQAAGVMAGVVEDLQDMVERDPGLSRGHLVPVKREDEDLVFTTHAQPARMDGWRPPLRAGPRYAEANEYVFKELLGLSDGELMQLLVDQVLY